MFCVDVDKKKLKNPIMTCFGHFSKVPQNFAEFLEIAEGTLLVGFLA